MVEVCCDIFGNELGDGEWYQAERKFEEPWVPTYAEYVDENRCIGCLASIVKDATPKLTN